MPNQKNLKLVEVISSTLEDKGSVLFLDYKGLTHRQMENLRNDLEKQGADLHVYKNTLLKIVLNKKHDNLEAQLDAIFAGPTASLFLSGDVVAPIKMLSDFIKTNELPVIKGGIIEDQYVDGDQVKQIASLPSREQLIGKLLGQIQAPMYGLVYTFTGVQRKLLYALNAIKDAKGGDHNG